MPPYQEPNVPTSNILRFIRVKRDIFVGNTIEDRHKNIVAVDDLSEAIRNIRKTEPAEIDAGFVSFTPEGLIFVGQQSDVLELPEYSYFKKARETTIRDFQEQSPSHIVKGERSRY